MRQKYVKARITHTWDEIFLEGNKIGGIVKGENVFLIPRIITIISKDLPFQFKRVQFSLKTALAMIINKAQVQIFHITHL